MPPVTMERSCDLSGKVAVVTGGGSGIGKATCLALAGAGAKVGILELREDTGFSAAEEIRASGGTAKAWAVDVSVSEAIPPAISRVADELGPVDILVNNAGLIAFNAVPPFWGPVNEVPVESFARMMQTNYLGVVAMTKAVLPAMMERRSGTIVNVASRYAWPEWTFARCAPYDASKWAVWAFSRCLRQEVHEYGIRVVTVHPGSTATGDEPNLAAVERGEALAASDLADMILYAACAPHRVEIKDVLITHSKE